VDTNILPFLGTTTTSTQVQIATTVPEPILVPTSSQSIRTYDIPTSPPPSRVASSSYASGAKYSGEMNSKALSSKESTLVEKATNAYNEDMEGDIRRRCFRHVDDDLLDRIGALLQSPNVAGIYCGYEDDQKVGWIQDQLDRMDSK